jgi:hypothetical protein
MNTEGILFVTFTPALNEDNSPFKNDIKHSQLLAIFSCLKKRSEISRKMFHL